MLVERRASSTGRIQRAKGQRHGCARIPSTLSFQACSGACLSCDTRAMRVSGGACPAKSQTFVQCCRQEQSATSSQSSRRRLVLDTVVSAVTLTGVAIADDAVATTCGVPTTVAAPAPFEGSIQAKLDCSVPGAQINLPGGLYNERIIVSKDVTILAPVVSRATIQWRTTQPYEAAVLVRPGATLRLENINVRHSSPSVANNYSVFCREGTLEAASCDISSASGSGIGIEGGTALISDCKIRDCKGSGAVVAGALLDSDTQELDSTSTKAQFVRVDISGNGRSGIIALDGASLQLSACTVSSNRKHGLELQDCNVEISNCELSKNGQSNILKGRPTTNIVTL